MARLRKYWLWLVAGIAVFVLGVLAITLLVPDSSTQLTQGSSENAVFIKLRGNGIEADASEVVISNFRPGARAEMTYRIHNATGAAITPEIYWADADIADYSKADGATRAPAYVADWLEIPKLTDIPPGQIVDYTVALVMPKDAKKPADKFGFQVGVAGKTDDKVQPAVGIWWIITMR